LLILAGLTIYPFVMAVWASLHSWTASIPARPFIGLDNYRDMADDDRLVAAVRTTAVIIAPALLIEFALGLALALLFYQAFPFRRLLMIPILLPLTIAPVVVGFTARMAFNAEYGFVNQLLSIFVPGDVKLAWLADPQLAPLAITFADVWEWTPLMFLILYSGLLTLPKGPLEAAAVDGASALQRLAYVVLPQLRYFIAVAILIRSLELIKLFDSVQLMTGGGPARSTETIGIYIYDVGFTFFNYGYASALSIAMLIVVALLVGVFLAVALRADKAVVR
jgi:multiple sugar transport system permease protein